MLFKSCRRHTQVDLPITLVYIASYVALGDWDKLVPDSIAAAGSCDTHSLDGSARSAAACYGGGWLVAAAAAIAAAAEPMTPVMVLTCDIDVHAWLPEQRFVGRARR